MNASRRNCEPFVKWIFLAKNFSFWKRTIWHLSLFSLNLFEYRSTIFSICRRIEFRIFVLISLKIKNSEKFWKNWKILKKIKKFEKNEIFEKYLSSSVISINWKSGISSKTTLWTAEWRNFWRMIFSALSHLILIDFLPLWNGYCGSTCRLSRSLLPSCITTRLSCRQFSPHTRHR